MTQKKRKNNRILDLYTRLYEGEIINKIEEAKRYEVNVRTIQRDIDDIRFYLKERVAHGELELGGVEYSRAQNGYRMLLIRE